MEVLLSRNSDSDMNIITKCDKKSSLMHIIIEHDNQKLVELLLENDADPDLIIETETTDDLFIGGLGF